MSESSKEEHQDVFRDVPSSSNTNGGKYQVHDLVTTPPPTFKDKIHNYFFNKGMMSRPQYLQDIYNQIPRYIYVNQELPLDMKMPHDETKLVIEYPRNKIRTTKYTPISFLPKNILFQFTNVANSYFLFLIILGAFQIFGVQSPGLAAVPLVVIVCITAIKDAFEDYSRARSDADLNNSPVHLLSGIENVNGGIDHVSGWRKFKKACTKGVFRTFSAIGHGWIHVFGSKQAKQKLARKKANDQELALRRVSTVISDYSVDESVLRSLDENPRMSFGSDRQFRKSMQSARSRTKPSKALPNSILNPELIAANGLDNAVTKFKSRAWKDITVGDMIRVRNNEEVPADIVLISCSDPEGNCAIETKNLDGETNLKTKTSLACGGSNNLKRSTDLGNCKFWIECDAPNSHLYAFKGTIHYENYDENGTLINMDEKEAITNDNVLLRGTTLRNTKWAIGVVVYTGRETKIMLNSGITPTKSSRISRELNLSVYINFGLLFIMCFISGLVNGLFYRKKDTSRIFYEFKPYGSTPAINGVLSYFVTLIIYQSLVPISLYISVEIIKTIQAFFIYADVKMYYKKLDFPCTPKAWNISDDLGQIEYVFSDKTGTLTQNVMEFRKCTIGGKSYGLAYTEAKQGLDRRNGVDIVKEVEKWRVRIEKDKEAMFQTLRSSFENDQLRDDRVTFVSSSFVDDTLNPTDETQKTQNEKFMMALALCHTVVTEPNPNDPTLRDFKAESPDEAALCLVASDMGFLFKGRTRSTLMLNIYGQDTQFEVLDIIPFTSERKRMSAIIQMPDGRIMLYSKGADNVIFQRLAAKGNSQETITKTALHLEDYAQEGLRTLCIAERELDRKYYLEWTAEYREAHASIDADRDERINKLSDEIENDLILLGGTAIEDRLQEGVPDAISILGQAGIKLWVLTGDRIETAINIGFSCNLLENEMKLLVIRPDDGVEDDGRNIEYIDELVTKYLQENFNLLHSNSTAELDKLIAEAQKDHSTPSPKFAVVIDGAALNIIFRDLSAHESESVRNLQRKFLILGKQCKSVICCRVSPSQKAEVVRLVKTSLSVMTLAIGDGANDVAMIQTADVGVGIAGEEGRQAVMSSDYGIGQFRYLTRLLLVHGRWSYKRLAEMVPCFFYKNVVFTLTLFWYNIFNNFDGSYLYEYTYLMFYNLAFTSLTVIVLAVLDQDVSDTVSLLVPQLFRSGILRKDWNQLKFIWYMIDGLYQSVISFFFPYLVYYKSFQNHEGLAVDHRFWMGVVCVIISVTSCNIYVLLQQYRWDWLSLLIYCLSILVVFFWTGVWSARAWVGEFYKAAPQVFGTLALWCVFFISVIVCLLPRFTYDFLNRNFRPKDVDIIRERVRMGVYDDYPQGFDPTNLEDIERRRLVNEIMEKDPEILNKLEHEIEGEKKPPNPVSKKFNSITRKATMRSRKNTLSGRSRHGTMSNHFNKPIDIDQLRAQMIKAGEYGTARTSLERINTTHELPGLTHAETLISYHTRNSLNFN